MLNEAYQDKLINILESFILNYAQETCDEGVIFYENEETLDNLYKSINEWLNENENILDEEVISDNLVISDLVENIINSIKEEVDESCKSENDDTDDSDDDSDDTDDDSDDDNKDDLKENAIRRKITKIQSILDKRKRDTDPQYKLSRQRTLRKIAARGGKVINKKLSKSLKKSFAKGFGKRWENEDDIFSEYNNSLYEQKNSLKNTKDKDSVEGEDVTPIKENKMKSDLSKKLSSKVKIQKEAVEEQLYESLKLVPSFGTLNEEETEMIHDTISKFVLESIDNVQNNLIGSLLEEFDEYTNEIVVPSLQEQVEYYINDEVIPSLQEDLDEYTSYMAEEIVNDLYSKTIVVKSRDSLQLEEFRNELLQLIQNKLQIIPEQEDALIVAENTCNSLKERMNKIIIEKVKLKNEIEELQRECWIKDNIPQTVSEATRESLINKLENISADNFYEFVNIGEKIIKESVYKNDYNLVVENTELKNNLNKLNNSYERDLINKTVAFLNK